MGIGRGTRYRLPMNSGHLVESSEDYEKLKNIAVKIRTTGKTAQALLQETILKLCANHYLTIKQLAELLNRKPESLRKHYINPMVDKKLLELRYPDKLNHPQQAYKAMMGG